jgi:hypothetical protein
MKVSRAICFWQVILSTIHAILNRPAFEGSPQHKLTRPGMAVTSWNTGAYAAARSPLIKLPFPKAKKKQPRCRGCFSYSGGEGGIRTHGTI